MTGDAGAGRRDWVQGPTHPPPNWCAARRSAYGEREMLAVHTNNRRSGAGEDAGVGVT